MIKVDRIRLGSAAKLTGRTYSWKLNSLCPEYCTSCQSRTDRMAKARNRYHGLCRCHCNSHFHSQMGCSNYGLFMLSYVSASTVTKKRQAEYPRHRQNLHSRFYRANRLFRPHWCGHSHPRSKGQFSQPFCQLLNQHIRLRHRPLQGPCNIPGLVKCSLRPQ